MALLDNIKNQLQSPQGQPGAGEGGQTQSVRDLLRAKTGKVSTPESGPRQSALQEAVAEQQTKAGQQQLGLRGRLQAEQLGQQQADIAQRTQQEGAQFQEQMKAAQADFDRRSNSMLDQFEAGQKSLKSQQDVADLEQLGFDIRMQNDQYVNQLQDIGKRNRLDNQLEFKKQLAQNVFKDQQDLLTNQLAFDRIVSADDREFTQELANMDINYAMQVADSAAKAASQRQVMQGVGGIVSGGIQSYGIFNSNSATSPGASGEANPGGTK